MKLGEALQIRNDLQKKIRYIGERLDNNAKVQQGESPAEDPKDLLSQLEQACIELENLISRINHTNATTYIEEKSITELLARRDVLKIRLQIMKQFLLSASQLTDRIYGTDIKVLSTVKVPTIQKEIDSLSKEYRQLEMIIQQGNWTTELL